LIYISLVITISISNSITILKVNLIVIKVTFSYYSLLISIAPFIILIIMLIMKIKKIRCVLLLLLLFYYDVEYGI